jgi:cysteine desulfurase/selenocysteine lyase
MIDIEKIRADFPILNEQVYGHKLVYLDNAATTQKPKTVVESIVNGYYHKNANVHRGVHWLSQEATEAHEAARETVRKFINAEKTSEIIFTRGTTESLNIVAATFGELLNEGDEIIVSQMEHHSNIVPWQLVCEKKGARLVMLPIDNNG